MIAAARLREVDPAVRGLQVGCELGRGAMSTVYQASRDGHTYALKVMRAAGDDHGDAIRRRFYREAVVLARLDHPGLVKVIEAGDLRGSPYLLMELVEGEELSAVLARGPVPPSRVVGLASTIAGALGEVHRHGLVHRDIKPANIIIDLQGTPRLIDFGLATRAVGEEGGHREEEVVGTFLYTAPEQAGLLKRPVDGRADLYSLGVILFECLAGTPPFLADDLGELLRQHAAVVPPRLHTLNDDIGPALSAIVARLLAKDPDDRYQSVEGLISDLERLEELETLFADAGDAVLGRNDRPEPPSRILPLAGREQELETFGTLWKEAGSGRGRVLAIEGEVGSGKTRLCQEFSSIASCAESGALVLRTRGSRGNAVPYGALRQALDTCLEDLFQRIEQGDTATRRLLERSMGELGPLVKSLSPAMARAAGDTGAVAQLEGELFNDALARFVANLAAESGRMLFVVDDAQWLDEGSREVLSRVASAAERVPILLVLAARSETEADGGRHAGSLGAFPAARHLALGPVDVEGVAELIAGHLGGHIVERRFVERLAVATNGNPLAVEEYVRTAVDAGLILPAQGQWRVDMDGFASLHLPADVFDLSLRRLEALSSETRRVLERAALAGRTFALHLLVDVAGMGEEPVNRAIAEATGANLVARTGAETYMFLQDRLCETLAAALDEPTSAEIHQKIGEALDAEDSDAPERVLAIARHYALGDWGKNPNRVFETNLEAGRLTLARYAYRDACTFLSTARNVLDSPEGQSIRADRAALEQALGQAARGVGRNRDAIHHFRNALQDTRDPMLAARLHASTGSVFVDEVDLDAAWHECMLALGALGKPYPSSKARQVFGALLSWFAAAVLRRLRIGYGSSRGERREKHKLLCHIYKLAGEIRYYAFEPVAMLLLTLRQLLYAHLLGPSLESVATSSWFGAVMANLKKRSIAEFYGRRAIEQAEEMGDPATLHASRMWANFSAHFLGDFKRAEEQWLQTLPDIDNWLHPRDYNKAVSDYCINLMMRGYMREALAVARRGMQKADQAHLTASSVMTRAYRAAILSVLGRTREATHFHYEALEMASALPEAERWARTIMLTYLAFGMVERGDLGAGLEELIETWESYAIPPGHVPAHPRPMFVFIAYARLRQYLRAPAESHGEALERVNRALRLLKMVEKLSYNDCHWFIIQAALARDAGKVKIAAELLEQAATLSEDADSEWGRFEVALERARLARQGEDAGAEQRHAAAALAIAEKHGWRARLGRLEAEFDAVSRKPVGGGTTLAATRTVHSGRTEIGGSSGGAVTTSRYLDALLQVSVASSSSLDPKERARAALDELVKVLGAERGFLFLEDKGELAVACARDARGQDIIGEGAYSTTVVDKVRDSGSPLVMVGDAERELSMAESVVAHGLKSIIAAPLTMDERFIGIVYLDSSLARGLFTEEDLEILTALANHIAIALETGRLVQVELERKAMEKDLALTSAVQSFFLPREASARTARFVVHGFYRPAAQCSGDWWWYDMTGDRIVVLVGDVTGHGAASAMLTASAATHYRALRRREPGIAIETLLEELNAELEDICQGKYNMTMSAVEIDAKTGQMRWFNAGGPALLILTGSGKVLSLSCAGTALGNDPFSLGVRERQLEPGDRLFMYTDGLPELTLPNGRQLGIRKLSKQLAATRDLATRDAVAAIADALDDARGDVPLDDDLTFVLVDMTGEAPAGSPPHPVGR